MSKKKIGIITTGGDCSGLNTVIRNTIKGCAVRKWDLIGILNGMDGLYTQTPQILNFTENTLSCTSYLSGSILANNGADKNYFLNSIKTNKMDDFNTKIKHSLNKLNLDALILVGGNGSLSLANKYRDIYSDLSLICIPKTIDMDVPLTDKTIGFDTAVQQLTSFCDQILLTARSHHRWFIVQSMGRDCGQLALQAGIATNADIILIPEIQFDIKEIINHIKKSTKDYGIIIISEGIKLRGHSGEPANILSKQLSLAGITNRSVFPEHFQRVGNTIASDRILSIGYVDCALKAIENKETYVMTSYQNGIYKTIPLNDFFDAGIHKKDPNIPNLITSDACLTSENILLQIAINMGIYIGKLKK